MSSAQSAAGVESKCTQVTDALQGLTDASTALEQLATLDDVDVESEASDLLAAVIEAQNAIGSMVDPGLVDTSPPVVRLLGQLRSICRLITRAARRHQQARAKEKASSSSMPPMLQGLTSSLPAIACSVAALILAPQSKRRPLGALFTSAWLAKALTSGVYGVPQRGINTLGRLEKAQARLHHWLVRWQQVQIEPFASKLLDREALRFWTSFGGTNCMSIPTGVLVGYLLWGTRETRATALKPSDMEVVRTVLSELLDVDNDEQVSVVEFAAFLRCFGPISRCIDKVISSLVILSDDEAQPPRPAMGQPWYLWRGISSEELEPQGGGSFIVRRCDDVHDHCVFKVSYQSPWCNPVNIRGGQAAGPEFDTLHLFIAHDPNSGYSVLGDGAGQHYDNLKELVNYRFHGLPYRDMSACLRLIVSGQEFLLPRLHVKDPESMLGRFVSEEHGHTFGKPIVLHRDIDAFRVVFNWYLTGDLISGKPLPMEVVRKEFAFFCIDFPPRGATNYLQPVTPKASGRDQINQLLTSISTPPPSVRRHTYMLGGGTPGSLSPMPSPHITSNPAAVNVSPMHSSLTLPSRVPSAIARPKSHTHLGPRSESPPPIVLTVSQVQRQTRPVRPQTLSVAAHPPYPVIGMQSAPSAVPVISGSSSSARTSASGSVVTPYDELVTVPAGSQKNYTNLNPDDMKDDTTKLRRAKSVSLDDLRPKDTELPTLHELTAQISESSDCQQQPSSAGTAPQSSVSVSVPQETSVQPTTPRSTASDNSANNDHNQPNDDNPGAGVAADDAQKGSGQAKAAADKEEDQKSNNDAEEQLPTGLEKVQRLPYFHHNFNRQKAEALLNGKQPGNFLLRPSRLYKAGVTLSVVDKSLKVVHVPLICQDDGQLRQAKPRAVFNTGAVAAAAAVKVREGIPVIRLSAA